MAVARQQVARLQSRVFLGFADTKHGRLRGRGIAGDLPQPHGRGDDAKPARGADESLGLLHLRERIRLAEYSGEGKVGGGAGKLAHELEKVGGVLGAREGQAQAEGAERLGSFEGMGPTMGPSGRRLRGCMVLGFEDQLRKS